jgi:deaminated glutathione amidase
MRAAAVQLNSKADVSANIAAAERQVRAAAAAGAELVVLPEKWTVLGRPEDLEAGAQPLDGEALSAAAGWARELGIDLLAGSIAERREPSGEDPRALANTSVLFDRDGERAAVYRKIHMFDVDVGGVAYRESELERPGEEAVTAPAAGLELGLTVCYDLRFPELYRILALRGANAVVVPSAFTAVTGEAHWEVLLRARAIENQLFVIAANQAGEAPPHFDSWGHSMIVGPWGDVLALHAEGEGFAVAELDLAESERIRRELPALANRRPASYRWPQEVGADA